jgi:hypothetical protein
MSNRATTTARELLTLLAENAISISCSLKDPFTVACSEPALDRQIVESHYRNARAFLDGLPAEEAAAWSNELTEAEAQECLDLAVLRHLNGLGCCPFCGLTTAVANGAEDLPEWLPEPPSAREELASLISYATGV